MSVQVDKSRAERLIAENRHKELVSALRSLEASVSKLGSAEPTTIVNDSPEIKECVKEIRALIKAIGNQPKPEAPVVNIENRNDEVIKAVQLLAENMPAQVPEREKEYIFEFRRNFTGMIESPIKVTVK